MQFQLTPQQFEARKLSVAEVTGEVLPAGPAGDVGEITHEGVTVDYTYDGTSLLLVRVKHKPMFVPESLVESKITDWFQA